MHTIFFSLDAHWAEPITGALLIYKVFFAKNGKRSHTTPFKKSFKNVSLRLKSEQKLHRNEGNFHPE